jgi:hypothetical protein
MFNRLKKEMFTTFGHAILLSGRGANPCRGRLEQVEGPEGYLAVIGEAMELGEDRKAPVISRCRPPVDRRRCRRRNGIQRTSGSSSQSLPHYCGRRRPEARFQQVHPGVPLGAISRCA